MPDPISLAALAGLGKGSLSDAVKQRLKDWLTDTVRVGRAIQKTADAFSTQLPGAKDALTAWVHTDAFRSAMQDLISGRTLPENLATADDFVFATGLAFGTAPPDLVRDMLAVFFENIREDLVSARQGLTLVDNRVGQVLRQVQELCANLAAALPGTAQVNIQRTSTELLNQIAQTQGWGGGLGYGTEIHVNLELPPTVQYLATRGPAVDEIRRILRTTAWYAMYGGSGSGKTQLGILVSRAFAGRKVWIRLGGSKPAGGLILESALATLAARQSGQSTQDWCVEGCGALGPDALIVLDDLPCPLVDSALAELLAAVCAACAHTGVRLVTTSSGPLSAGTRAAAGSRVREEAAPSFHNADVRDLFRSYGAPESFLASRWLGFVHSTAKEHPVLLVEAARYLQSRGWATDDRSFDDLVRGTFASALDLPTLDRIQQTVPQATTREFLYRLKVIGWPFGIEEVQRISAVPPPVMFPLEHLAAVAGLWVQQDGDGEYVVSPLLARLADENLPKELQQAIHLTLAQGILQKRRLGPLQASQAITHFVSAGDPDSGASVLLVASHGMLGMSEVRDPFTLTSIWADMPLPALITLQKRIYLRAHQVILRRRLGRNDRYEIADLERLMTEGESLDECQLVIAGVGAMLATYLGDNDPALAVRSLARSIRASRRVAPDIVLDPELGLHTGLLTMLWAIPTWIKRDEDYEHWFAVVRDLTPDELRQWCTIPLAVQASEIVCNGLWTRTADRPGSERNWDSVRKRLEQLQGWARLAGVPSLVTSALRSQIIVLAEYQQQLPEADTLAQWGMEEFCGSPQSRFLIADSIARQHYYFGEATNAIRWFDAAFANQEAAEPSARVSSLTLAGVAAHQLNLDTARRYLEQGVAAAKTESVGALLRVTVLGELGILLWNAGQHREAYATWSGAVQELLAARKDTGEWKTLFQLIGNCTGYFLSGFRGGPVTGAELIVPFTGILLRAIKDIDQLYNPEQAWLLPLQMALLAESIGAYDEALTWAKRISVGSGTLGAAAPALLRGLLLADEISGHRCAEVIRAADLCDLDEISETLDSVPLDDERRAQRLARFSARLNLVALAIEIARVGLQDGAAGKALAHTAAELCRDRAVQRAGSRLWLGAVEVFESLEHRGASWRELWDKATASREQGNTALQVMYSVAASAVAAPREAAQIQLQNLPWLEQVFSPALYHVTVARFVPQFWLWALEQSPMSFGLLIRTRRAVADAQALGDKPCVHSTLRTVVFSLAVRVPDYIQSWLDEFQA